MSHNKVIDNEIVTKDINSKTIYHYRDDDNGFNFKSKEVYKKEDITIYYPFIKNWKDKEIKQKYRKIKSVTLAGFKNSIPSGLLKTYTRGYGLTRNLKPLINFIEKNFDVEDITISKKEKTKIGKNKLVISYNDFEKIRRSLSSESQVWREKGKTIVNNFFSDFFPYKFEDKKKLYQKGQLSNLFEEHQNIMRNLSSEDKSALLDLFDKLSKRKDLFEKRLLIKTKEEIDQRYIEDVLDGFDKKMKLKRIGEQKWQFFFTENSWIFSQLFSYPAVFLQGKAYVGGKGIENRNGKVIDFLYQNNLTKNTALIEIKTHKTKLLHKKSYRGTDVFPLDRELTGAIGQLLDQKDNFIKEFYKLKSKSEKKDFESFNPKCILLAGNIKDLDKKQRNSFELWRTSLKDVEIVTFDELHEKIKAILSIFRSNKNERK